MIGIIAFHVEFSLSGQYLNIDLNFISEILCRAFDHEFSDMIKDIIHIVHLAIFILCPNFPTTAALTSCKVMHLLNVALQNERGSVGTCYSNYTQPSASPTQSFQILALPKDVELPAHSLPEITRRDFESNFTRS